LINVEESLTKTMTKSENFGQIEIVEMEHDFLNNRNWFLIELEFNRDRICFFIKIILIFDKDRI